MRALENNLIIKVGLSDTIPLGVDTEKDLKKVIKEMAKHERKSKSCFSR